MHPNLFEAWDGLTIKLSQLSHIEFRPAQPRCAGVAIPSGVFVNHAFYPDRTKDDYNRLKDAAMAFEKAALESAKTEPTQAESEAGQMTKP